MIDMILISYLLGLFTATGIACLVIQFGDIYEEDETDAGVHQE